ncbi:MAG TPA: M28 family peptidase [Allosphingosinicella sp.]|jgi:Zn-dependent M28 family amino/carboxypeptidase
MFSRAIRASAALLLFLPAAAPAQSDAPITAQDLRRHVEVLASDRFEGREPTTEGERLTTAYIVEQFRARGLEPAAPGGGWLQPVPLVQRSTSAHRAGWRAAGRPIPFENTQIALQGNRPDVRIADAPVVFAGHGARIAERGIDQLAGADLRGAVVLILYDSPEVAGFPSFAERVAAVGQAGAGAVIAITAADVQWRNVSANYSQPSVKLADQLLAPIVGAMPLQAAQRLIAAAGGDLGRLLNEQPGSSFRSVPLPLRADLQVSTEILPLTSNNVIGRLRGSGGGREALLLLGHWDHLGVCRGPEERDRICNGAVDNASGIAALIEVAGRLSRGTRPVRDILFMATTVEERGLLGAEYFTRHPAVPLQSIVAAVNLDTMAIAGAGRPIDYSGRGNVALDAAIAAAAAAQGRVVAPDGPAAQYEQRNDAWALAHAGVPAVGLVGGAFSDTERLNAFLFERYHRPEDEVAAIDLSGAAQDSDLLVALARRLADPAQYQRRGGGRP